MKDITLRTYICEECGKKFTVQSVYDLLIKQCDDCYLKPHLKEYSNE